MADSSEVEGALEQRQVKQHGLAMLCSGKCMHCQSLMAEWMGCFIAVILH